MAWAFVHFGSGLVAPLEVTGAQRIRSGTVISSQQVIRSGQVISPGGGPQQVNAAVFQAPPPDASGPGQAQPDRVRVSVIRG